MTTAVLSTKVDVFDGFTEFSAKPGVIILTDDNRLEISKIDPTSGDRIEKVMDVALSELVLVRGSSSNLTFSTATAKKTVGFSFGARSLIIFGLLGILIGQLMASRSGQTQWIAELKKRGVQVQGGPINRQLAIVGAALILALLVFSFVASSLHR